MMTAATVGRRALLGSAALLTGTALAGAAPAASTSASTIVDVHTHAVPAVWREAVAATEKVASDQATVMGMRLPPWSPDAHLAYMDRNGIAAGVLSWPEAMNVLRGPQARKVARAMNEYYAGIIAKHPTRFGAFASVPLDDMDAANEETAYALDVLKLEGVTSTCHFESAYLGHPRYDPWFAELNRRKATLFAHPTAPQAMDQVYVGPNPSTIEFMFDSTRMVTNMLLTGAKARYPEMKVISTHGGGTIPFLAHRLMISLPFYTAPGRPKMTMEDVRAGLASFYYDLTASSSPAQLDAIRHLVPASQLMIGFDWPFMPEALTMPEMKAFNGYAGFTNAERAAIASGNALKMFPALAQRRAA